MKKFLASTLGMTTSFILVIVLASLAFTTKSEGLHEILFYDQPSLKSLLGSERLDLYCERQDFLEVRASDSFNNEQYFSAAELSNKGYSDHEIDWLNQDCSSAFNDRGLEKTLYFLGLFLALWFLIAGFRSNFKSGSKS